METLTCRCSALEYVLWHTGHSREERDWRFLVRGAGMVRSGRRVKVDLKLGSGWPVVGNCGGRQIVVAASCAWRRRWPRNPGIKTLLLLVPALVSCNQYAHTQLSSVPRRTMMCGEENWRADETGEVEQLDDRSWRSGRLPRGQPRMPSEVGHVCRRMHGVVVGPDWHAKEKDDEDGE